MDDFQHAGFLRELLHDLDGSFDGIGVAEPVSRGDVKDAARCAEGGGHRQQEADSGNERRERPVHQASIHPPEHSVCASVRTTIALRDPPQLKAD